MTKNGAYFFVELVKWSNIQGLRRLMTLCNSLDLLSLPVGIFWGQWVFKHLAQALPVDSREERGWGKSGAQQAQRWQLHQAQRPQKLGHIFLKRNFTFTWRGNTHPDTFSIKNVDTQPLVKKLGHLASPSAAKTPLSKCSRIGLSRSWPDKDFLFRRSMSW